MASKKGNKEINLNNLVVIKPLTDNQKVVFNTWKKDKNQFLFGAAGTGKTLFGVGLELGDVLWYISALADDLGVTLEEVAQANVDKLQSRMARNKIKGDGDNR